MIGKQLMEGKALRPIVAMQLLIPDVNVGFLLVDRLVPEQLGICLLVLSHSCSPQGSPGKSDQQTQAVDGMPMCHTSF